VPKHRRSEIEPSRVSVRTPANRTEFWPEAVGYGQAAGAFGPPGVHGGFGHQGNGYRGPAGYTDDAAEPGWQIAPEGQSWQDWEHWQDWGPPPELHPDHPSAPVPRVQFATDHPSGPMPASRTSGPPGVPRWWPDEPARTRNAPPPSPDAGHDNGNRWLYAVPDDASYPDHAAPREVSLSQEQRGFRWQETTDYRRGGNPPGLDRGPAPGRFQDGAPPSRDSLWTAGQVLTLAESRAAQIAQQAQDYAAEIREAAQREAAAITQQATGHAATTREAAERQAAEIREAAEREAGELRARLDSMTGELGRVAAYVAENLAAPPMPATAPALPGAALAPPGTRPARPATTPTKPDTGPAKPITKPTKPDTGPARPAKPGTTATKKPQKPGRQQQAMRIAQYSTAALVSFALVFGAAEIGIHGLKFFVFREQGQGQSTDGPTDQQFLARQAAATHHAAAPKGRHHKQSDHLEVHH